MIEFQKLTGHRSSAAFCFLILIYFMDYSSDIDANFPCLCRSLTARFLSLPAEHRLRSAAAATSQRSLGCKCESAVVVPAALPPALHGAAAGQVATLLSPAEPGAAQRVEQAERLARGTQQQMQRQM